MSEEAEGLIEYGQASTLLKTEPSRSCDIYLLLAEKKEFILRDAAYVRSLQNCDLTTHVVNWDRPVPSWLEKEKSQAFYKTLQEPIQKALFVQKNPQYFLVADRIQNYQTALAQKDIKPEDKIALENSLYSLAPRFMPEPQDKDTLRIVKDYRSVRDFAKAKSFLKKMIVSPKFSWDDKALAHKELVYTLKLQKDQAMEEYLKAAKSWAQFVKPSELQSSQKLAVYYESQVNYVRVIWTEKGTDEALKHLLQLQKTLQGRRSLFELYWLEARMYEEKKNFPEAVRFLEMALKENISQWRDKEKILWSLAWSYLKNQQNVEAEKHLSTLIESSDTSAYARFKYLYWKGEALLRQNKTEAAHNDWKRIVDEDIFGYYNLLAHSQLQMPLRTYEIKPYNPQKLLSEQNEKLFAALQKVNETELAARLLSLEGEPVNALKDASVDDIASLFFYHAEIHNYKFIFQIFNQLPYEKQRDVFLKIPQQLFPQPHAEYLYDISQKNLVEPELVYSIMRQESSFDPKARSPMDAFGLLQILPDVAKRIARENNIPYKQFEDLYDEKTNIAIGTLLIKKQMSSFKNRFVLYVASYNASSAAVRRWHERNNLDDLMFIEDIPYEETKAYVKLVLRNMIIYKKLKQGDGYKFFPREMLNLNPTEPSTAPPANSPPEPTSEKPSV